LGDFFEIKRGLATGDNNFFILEREKISELGMDMSFFKPILPSPRYLKMDFVSSDKDGIPQIEPQYFLLDCELSEQEIEKNYPATWDYLQSGVNKTSKKYLCKNRKKWYWQEQRESTYFLCSYMGRRKDNRSPIRFILNLSDAVATNSYLMLYPKEHLQQAISENPHSVYKIWEMLKSIRKNEIEEEGCVYGGGLKKIEPKELAKVSCGDLVDLCAV
jgi:adenine-specific DNA-methyltransferase